MGPSSPQTASCDANRFLQITIDHILQKPPIMSRPFNINAPQLDPFLLNRPAAPTLFEDVGGISWLKCRVSGRFPGILYLPLSYVAIE